MELLFIKFFQLSAICSFGILFIFLVSPMLRKKYTVFWRYCLWILLAVRLLIPFDLSISGYHPVVISLPFRIPVWEQLSSVELEGGQETGVKIELDLEENTLPTRKAENEKGTNTPLDEAIKDSKEERETIQNDALKKQSEGNFSIKDSQDEGLRTIEKFWKNKGIWERILWWTANLWAAGVILLLIWKAICYVFFCFRIKRTEVFYCKKENLSVYISNMVDSPMLMGLRKPKIVLPSSEYKMDQLSFILEHEFSHYKRKDLWVKLLLDMARIVHWFNPFVILMERQAAQDIELLCDSRVVRCFSKEEKKLYSNTLLNCASSDKGKNNILCTSEFSKNVESLKERFTNIFFGERKKRGILAVIFGTCLLLLISLVTITGASDKENELASQKMENSYLEKEDAMIAKREAKKEETLSLLLELTEEKVANANYGVVFPNLIFASEQRAVLYDYWGLLIYDMENCKIEQLLDLRAAGFNKLQGDQVTHIEVSSDGGQILLYNEPDVQERFIYNIADKSLEYSDMDTFIENHYDGIHEQGEQKYLLTDTGKTVYLSADSLYDANGELYYPNNMQGLSLIVLGENWGESEIQPLFLDKYEMQEKEIFSRLKISDFGRIVGKKFLYRDANGWSYYLEEDEEKESAIWKIAEILEPLLLTRYKDNKRQVLEDLMFQEAWRECPIMFVDGRIIYKAAQSADIVGVKNATLVSIAMDGTDRKIADTILYNVFDGICEDNGWIYYSGWANDTLLPKSLCRISPDFSSGAQYVDDIPGYLCGVMNGYIYYLAGKEKKSGIWKRNLSTGEEQIYDKWGIAAEDISNFWVREREFSEGELHDEAISGCNILYTYGYDGEIYSCKIPFDDLEF